MMQAREREARIGFRPLSLDDMPRMLAWLSDPAVSPWYSEGELTVENLTGKYRGPVEGSEPTRCYIITVDGRDAGFIQAYVIDDHPDYARQIDLPAGAVGTDLFLGEAAIRGQGWGVPVLRAFHRRIVFGEMGATVAVIAPSPENARAIHVYEGAGFLVDDRDRGAALTTVGSIPGEQGKSPIRGIRRQPWNEEIGTPCSSIDTWQ